MELGRVVLVLVIYVLAVARVTRLINADTILDPLRLIPIRRAREHQRITKELEADFKKAGNYEHHRAAAARWETVNYFLGCPWCVGWWICVASAYLPVRLIGWPAWALIPVALAASHLVGVCARFADTEDVDIETVEPQ